MKITKGKYVLLIFLAAATNIFCQARETYDDTCRVLFIGSSYFEAFDVLSLFSNLAAAGGKSVEIDESVRSGLYLADHVLMAETEAKINSKDWDYVVLQGVGSLMAYPDSYTHHPVYPALQALCSKIHNNCSSTKVVFCLPWAYEDGMTWLQGWTDTYNDMQDKIYDNTLKYAGEIEFIIAPVGWAWKTVLNEKSFPLHYLHLSDWNHPSLKGSYLMACVIYSTLFCENVLGNSYYYTLEYEEAHYFQTVASQTVMQNTDLWKIPTTDIYENEVEIPEGIKLNQNYPNPFNPATVISYQLSVSGEVELSVFNSIGEKVCTLFAGNQNQGNHSVVWNGMNQNGHNMPSGMYYYSLRSDAAILTNKMILLK